MQAYAAQQISPEEYLAGEREADVRHEYFAGEVFAMAGASREHNQIAANIIRVLGNQFIDRPCSVFASDMKVKISAIRKYTYPDIVAVCGKEDYADKKNDVLLNPVLLAEILSDGTEAYDRGDKFSHYQLLTSLTEYILIAQHCCKVERFVRQENSTWIYSIHQDMQDVLVLESIQCELPLAEVYRRVQFREHRLIL